MFRLQKPSDRDFIILNITDIQILNEDWENNTSNVAVFEHTMTELLSRITPDLITITGDIANRGDTDSYRRIFSYFDSLSIPWAPIWGNHEYMGKTGYADELAEMLGEYKNCLFEKGDRSLGNGNYIIEVDNGEKVCEGIFMFDSHDMLPYVTPEGKEKMVWATLSKEQLEWYSEQNEILKEKGCTDTIMFMHIPPYVFREAWNAAFREDLDMEKISVEESMGEDCWNEGYKDSFGVRHEEIGGYPEDDGVIDAAVAGGTASHIVCGHSHRNNYVINYRGVKIVYALKTGTGSYFEPALCGGTVFAVGDDGIKDVYHEYVDISHLIDKKD
ncbi:MAG: hypothetical protein E7672_00675 [Ruminococcaceae bacterium]|nr:hypothetical protein [Oscillospiraceae bacterium]